MEKLLEVKDLKVSFFTDLGETQAVKDAGFAIEEGDFFGIVGESGSGKSVTTKSILRLGPSNCRIMGGEILFQGEDILKKSEAELREIRGGEIAMIFQDSLSALNPVYTVGNKMVELIRRHTSMTKKEAKARVLELLTAVGITDPEKAMRSYPHELSGGMRQRVMIAMAIINHPDLIIADEPTTALDVTVQAQILNLLKKIHRDMGSSILFISHDLNVIKEVCQKVVVMYKGVIVERGDAKEVLKHPKHEYTRKLVASMPDQVRKSQNTKKLLEVQDLNVYYKENKKLFSSKDKRKHIIHGMSFDLYEGEILGVVGESGCGKSTLAKTIVGLNREYDGKLEMDHLKPQMVFQDPFSSLNPARKIGWILEEPLKLKGIKDKKQRKELVNQMLTEIGLDPSFANRYARELSGGQRQRISIGLSLMRGEKFIIADEPVSALDVTVQSQILRLLLKLHDEKNLTYMFISHDLNVVHHMCHRVIVMYLGRIVEMADVDELYDHPCHPYTRMLFDSILTDEEKETTDSVTVNEILPETVDGDGGCPFYGRCRYAGENCLSEVPTLTDIGTPGHPHLVRCERIAYGEKYTAAD